MKISDRHEFYAKEILLKFASNPVLSETQKRAEIVKYLDLVAQCAITDYVNRKVVQDLPAGR